MDMAANLQLEFQILHRSNIRRTFMQNLAVNAWYIIS